MSASRAPAGIYDDVCRRHQSNVAPSRAPRLGDMPTVCVGSYATWQPPVLTGRALCMPTATVEGTIVGETLARWTGTAARSTHYSTSNDG
jgi:hypothetical protein